ncbi:MAG: copper resistance protein NlpE N-terminal domain-containing protein [Bacteroidia bacterium]|tara:strand:+ start:1206 stop:1622 length:417 start_codon:yes stop_codon:yes gene_type:complete
MKIINNPSIVAIATAVVIFNFTSCKYEDGPNISLRSKKARLTGEWEVKFIDGAGMIGNDMEITLEFDKDGDLEFNQTYSDYGNSYTYSQKGEWEWEDGKQSLEITLDGNKQEWEITRLTNKEFEFEDEGNNKWELEKN